MRIHMNLPKRKKTYEITPTLELACQLELASICRPVPMGPVDQRQMQIHCWPGVPRIHANPCETIRICRAVLQTNLPTHENTRDSDKMASEVYHTALMRHHIANPTMFGESMQIQARALPNPNNITCITRPPHK